MKTLGPTVYRAGSSKGGASAVAIWLSIPADKVRLLRRIYLCGKEAGLESRAM